MKGSIYAMQSLVYPSLTKFDQIKIHSLNISYAYTVHGIGWLLKGHINEMQIQLHPSLPKSDQNQIQNLNISYVYTVLKGPIYAT